MMKALKIILLVLAPIGILCGLFDIGYSIFVTPFNPGYAALGLVFIFINSLSFVVGILL